MLKKLVRPGLIIVPLLAFLWGCNVELRSPIKITRTKEEEKASPPRKVVVAPSSEQSTVTRPKAVEDSPISPEASRKLSPSTDQPGTVSPKNIVILSHEYLAATHYKILGKVTVKDVSQNGFSKPEAKEALKVEAFRQFGRQAKGITSITYQGETSFFGSERYYEASGDVITWAEGDPPYRPEGATPPAATKKGES